MRGLKARNPGIKFRDKGASVKGQGKDQRFIYRSL
jgi:hypothetical protein